MFCSNNDLWALLSHTAEAVLDAINAGNPFAAAILDLTIPGGRGGKEIIGDLLKLDPDMKVIALSGYSDNPVMSRPSDYGFAASLKKPYRRHDLSVMLKTVSSYGMTAYSTVQTAYIVF